MLNVVVVAVSSWGEANLANSITPDRSLTPQRYGGRGDDNFDFTGSHHIVLDV